LAIIEKEPRKSFATALKEAIYGMENKVSGGALKVEDIEKENRNTDTKTTYKQEFDYSKLTTAELVSNIVEAKMIEKSDTAKTYSE